MDQIHVSRSEARKKKKRLYTWFLIGFVLILSLLVALNYDKLATAQEGFVQTAKTAFGPKGILEGEVFENYPDNPPARKIRITINGKQVKVPEPRYFKVDNLPAGKHSVVIEGENYEKLTKTIEIKRGKNRVSFSVCLTPEEAAKRWMKTKQENNHAGTYLCIHPDERVKIKRGAYVEYKTALQNRFDLSISNYKIGSTEFLKSWKHPATGKVYKDIAKIRASGVIVAKGEHKVEKSWDIYAQKHDGRWTFFIGN